MNKFADLCFNLSIQKFYRFWRQHPFKICLSWRLELVIFKMELAEGSVVYYPIERCPANFITLVGSRVEVLTVNQMTYSGNIYSMDPITGR